MTLTNPTDKISHHQIVSTSLCQTLSLGVQSKVKWLNAHESVCINHQLHDIILL